MDLIHKLRNYLLEEEFSLNVYKDKVDIMNYTSIGHFDTDQVLIRYEGGDLLIKGKNLVVTKLLHDEVLIEGKIGSVELR